MKAALAVALVFAACGETSGGTAAPALAEPAPATPESAPAGGTEAAPPPAEGRAVAAFAGGCFWCMEGPFEALDGVISAESGYTGGHVDHVRYEQMHSGRTGHFEAVRVVYDPARVTYERLLEVFWRNVDPTQDDGQFCDRGPHYRSAIFVSDEEERAAATASRDRVARRLHARVVTEIRDASTFWLAEDYHQNYYRTHPTEYRRYRTGCGRDRRLRELWGDDAAH